jgi:hypothetical protein
VCTFTHFFNLFLYQFVCISHFHLLLLNWYIFLFSSLACMLVGSNWWYLLKRVNKIAKMRLWPSSFPSVRPSVRVFRFSFLSVRLLRKGKVKQFHYRPGKALRIPGGWGSQISRQSAHEGGKVVSPTHRPPFTPQEVFLVLISVRGWVDTSSIVQPEG